jgi:large subunit ribosomal protein L22
MSPRKVRLVINTVRGLNVQAAETRLSFLNKGASEPVLKLLRSAMANAEHNFHLAKETLVIKTITADGGPTLKRSRPRAFGRSAPIRKRTTHINIVLAPKEGTGIASAPVAETTPAPAAKKPARRATTATAKPKSSKATKAA